MLVIKRFKNSQQSADLGVLRFLRQPNQRSHYSRNLGDRLPVFGVYKSFQMSHVCCGYDDRTIAL